MCWWQNVSNMKIILHLKTTQLKIKYMGTSFNNGKSIECIKLSFVLEIHGSINRIPITECNKLIIGLLTSR